MIQVDVAKFPNLALSHHSFRIWVCNVVTKAPMATFITGSSGPLAAAHQNDQSLVVSSALEKLRVCANAHTYPLSWAWQCATSLLSVLFDIHDIVHFFVVCVRYSTYVRIRGDFMHPCYVNTTFLI